MSILFYNMEFVSNVPIIRSPDDWDIIPYDTAFVRYNFNTPASKIKQISSSVKNLPYIICEQELMVYIRTESYQPLLDTEEWVDGWTIS
jgi:hypothetical protein